jgi:hypothetical protein
MRFLTKYIDDTKAGIALNFALIIGPIFAVGISALGIQQVNGGAKKVQTQIDHAVISAARVFIDLYSETDKDMKAEAKRRVRSLQRTLNASSERFENVVFSVDLDFRERQAVVNASGSFRILPRDMDISISRKSAARAEMESQPVCILALEEDATAITFSGNGEVKAKDCVVWSNSSGFQSIRFDGRGKVETERLCTVGRAGSRGQFEVKPGAEEKCERVSDPMSGWDGPTVGYCDYQDFDENKGKTVTLRPGVYCGGLRLHAKEVEFRPGLYIIQDGPLEMKSDKEIKGEAVGIFLTGKDTRVEMGSDAKIELTSMNSGPMAGIAIAQDPASPGAHSSFISGRTDLKVGGVVYLPDHNLRYWGESDTEAASPVTTIIARTIEIGGTAYLEVKNDKDKAKYAPVLETGHGEVILVR